MEQTYYGVDIVLHPKKERGKKIYEQGKVIEINGSRSGSSFYKVGDMDFYSKVVNEFSRACGGEKIFTMFNIESAFKFENDEPTKNSLDEYYIKEIEDQKKTDKTYRKNNFVSVNDLKYERLEWEKVARDGFFMPPAFFFLNAAGKESIDIDYFSEVNFSNGLLSYKNWTIEDEFKKSLPKNKPGDPLAVIPPGGRFQKKSGESILPIEAVGLVISSLDMLALERGLGRSRVLNGAYLEGITDDKALLYFASSLLPKEKKGFENFIPKSFLYGSGIHTKKKYKKWLSSIDSKLFVKKPVVGSHGIGVEFLSREDMNKYAVSPFYDNSKKKVKDAYFRIMFDFLLDTFNFNDDVVVFQEASRSSKVVDEESGKKYHACARAIVQNGKYVGAIWRSNKKSGNGTTVLDRHKHNITNGAGAMPVSKEDELIIKELAEAAVDSFEKTAKDAKEVVEEINIPHFENYRYDVSTVDRDLLGLYKTMYLSELSKTASYYGVDIIKNMNWYTKQFEDRNFDLTKIVEQLNRSKKRLSNI